MKYRYGKNKTKALKRFLKAWHGNYKLLVGYAADKTFVRIKQGNP